MQFNHIHDLIGRSQLERAIDEVLKMLPEGQKTEIRNLQQRLQKLKRDSRMGTISYSEETTQRNKIATDLLDTLEELQKPVSRGVPDLATKLAPKLGTRKVYFSYAWGGQEEKGKELVKVVDRLFESLNAEGFNVLRDSMNIQYGGLISEFMKELGEGDLIVVFISEAYAKSEYCMYELYEIARNSKWDRKIFSTRVLPVPLERIRFDDPDVLDEYFNHWEKAEEKWEKLVKRRIKQVSPSQSTRYHNTRAIHQNFGELSDWLIDINSSTLQLVSENDFQLVKEAIEKRLGDLKNKRD